MGEVGEARPGAPPDLGAWPLEEPDCANPYMVSGAQADAGGGGGLSVLGRLLDSLVRIPRRDKDE